MTKPNVFTCVFLVSFLHLILISAAGAAGKIMPLGNSITRGVVGSADEIGYRRSLYISLIDAGFSVDFVGSHYNGIPNDFDKDHEGHGGWRADEIVSGRPAEPWEGKLDEWLIAEEPDIVLLHIGTNDISFNNQNWTEIEDILVVIDDYEFASGKAVWVILSLIIDRSCDPFIDPCAKSAETTAFNNDVRDYVFFKRYNDGDKIILVDMQNDAGLDYRRWITGGDMWDDLHPSATGYTKMADLWFSALAGILPLADAGPDQIVFDEITLDGSRSNHPDGKITSYQWQLIHRQNPDFNRTASGVSPTVLDLQNGFYDVILTIKDADGRTDTDQMLFTATGPKGDFDFDNDVDEYDLSVFGEVYGTLESP